MRAGSMATWVRRLRGRPGAVTLGGDALAAHAHVDPRTGRLLTFSHRVALGARGARTQLTFHEFDQVLNLCRASAGVSQADQAGEALQRTRANMRRGQASRAWILVLRFMW